MAITITQKSLQSAGSEFRVPGKMNFDNSYGAPEVITSAQLRLSRINSFKIDSQVDGYSFETEIASDKKSVSVYVRQGGSNAVTPSFNGSPSAPLLRVEENVTVASNNGNLLSQPSYVIAVYVSAGSTTGGFKVVPQGVAPASGECSINFTNGQLTFNASDAVTLAQVTYAPRRNGSMFDQGGAVYDESITAAAAGTNLANRAWAVQYVYDTTGGTLLTPIPVGETPGAGEVAIDIDNAGSTTITTNSGIDGNTLVVTYQKFQSLPNDAEMHIGDSDLSLTSEAYNWLSDGNYKDTVIPGLGVHVVGEETGAGNEAAVWGGPSVTPANGLARFRPVVNDLLTNNTNAFVTLAMPWCVLASDMISGAQASGTIGTITAGPSDEVGPGTDLSSLTDVEFTGYGLI